MWYSSHAWDSFCHAGRFSGARANHLLTRTNTRASWFIRQRGRGVANRPLPLRVVYVSLSVGSGGTRGTVTHTAPQLPPAGAAVASTLLADLVRRVASSLDLQQT